MHFLANTYFVMLKLEVNGRSRTPYTRPKIVISGKYGIVNIDIKTKSGEPLT